MPFDIKAEIVALRARIARDMTSDNPEHNEAVKALEAELTAMIKLSRGC